MSDNEYSIIVVEDNNPIADMYQKWLTEEEYDAEATYTGEDAISLVDDDVDLVLLDRDLPNLNGDEVLEKLRRRHNDLMVTMLTATDAGAEIVDLECDDYIRKPIPQEKLLSTVEKLLDRKQYSPEMQEYLALARKVEILEKQHSTRRLEGSEDYQKLMDRLEELYDEVEDELSEIKFTRRPNLDF